MIYNDLKDYKCLSCNGTGRVSCECNFNNEKQYDKNYFICRGEGNFKCPLCEGKGMC